MRVNISGKGLIPILGTVAPAYNVELSESQIKRLLNFQTISVFATDTGRLITKKNINEVFSIQPSETSKGYNANNMKITVPNVETPVIEQPIEEVSTTQEAETGNEVSIDNEVNDYIIPETVETVPEEVSNEVDDEPIEEDTTDEPVQTSEQPSEPYNRRNKKKKRH